MPEAPLSLSLLSSDPSTPFSYLRTHLSTFPEIFLIFNNDDDDYDFNNYPSFCFTFVLFHFSLTFVYVSSSELYISQVISIIIEVIIVNILWGNTNWWGIRLIKTKCFQVTSWS